MNKFKALVSFSKFSWIVAIVLMSVNWFRLWDYAFRNTHHVIEDKFIYIGILGGWIFVGFFYIAIILLVGYFILRTIGELKDDVLGRKEVK